MKYGMKLHSTMCGTTTYIFLDTKDDIEKAFQLFKDYIESDNEEWIDFCYKTNHVYCSESDDFMVGRLDNGKYVLVTDRDKAIEFELVKDYTERF